MAKIRLLVLVTVAATWCLGLSGCIAFYSYYPVSVTVHDAETNTPIAGAAVGVHYWYMLVLNAPKPISAPTDKEGAAVLQVANFNDQEFTALAEGFLPDRAFAHIRPPGQTMAFHIYRGPVPHITIVVPNGYHGPVKIELRPVSQWVQDQIGKREFTFRASSTGLVVIDATPLLLRMDVLTISAAYDNGRPIPYADYHVAATDTGFRFFSVSGHRTLFIVGTQKDEEDIERLLCPPVNGNSHDVEFNPKAFDALFDQRP